MKFYHVTRIQAAGEIEQQGFKDSESCYANEHPVRGVWIAARPLIAECGFEDTAVFEVDLPAERLRRYELPKDPKGYRQWCVPASLLNEAPRRRLHGEETMVPQRSGSSFQQ